MNSAPSPIVLSEQDKRTEVSGFVFTETFRPSGLILPAHFHEHANIALTIEGSFMETVGTRPYEVNPSSVIFRPAGEKHSNRYGKTAAHCLIIEVGPQRLAAIRQVTRILDRASCVEGGPISSLALRIFREFRRPDAIAPLSIEALTLEMLVEATRVELMQGRNPPQWLRQARELIRERFSQPLSLSSVAEVAGVHAAHLAKAFRRYYGSTVGEYVRRLRLDYAARLLRQSDRTLSAIALITGFYDQSHFAHVFKLRFGMTPGRFRADLGKKRAPNGSKKQNTPPD